MTLQQLALTLIVNPTPRDHKVPTVTSRIPQPGRCGTCCDQRLSKSDRGEGVAGQRLELAPSRSRVFFLSEGPSVSPIPVSSRESAGLLHPELSHTPRTVGGITIACLLKPAVGVLATRFD